MSADNNPRGFAQETEASTAPEREPQHEVTPVPAVSTIPVVRVEPLGATFEAPPELTLLEAASFAGIRLPRLCRNGTCRTCLCRIVSGEIRYTIEWPGLSREEKAQGDVLTCVAVALTDLVLDVPDAELA
ncbi:ferredoxin [Paraburkholderia tropica]|jgi:ferredoxin|uniref:Ferredoxin n=1 Tax=Paraburkholderia tropica TaxID=92647 RepID=A0AAQ1JS47_9BURK|nr:ferredoxin [Paraburkholderia tropica]MBB2998558.1 ferredoxin [Paraburkholderia tropica]MBB6318667.1 ferredoxin [Paraburkholderia tropica]PXX20028.1 ferredoxin [Paraburkholderia tropica]PZW88969.1 ferredoxin [Paraburkholderia tropica]